MQLPVIYSPTLLYKGDWRLAKWVEIKCRKRLCSGSQSQIWTNTLGDTKYLQMITDYDGYDGLDRMDG